MQRALALDPLFPIVSTNLGRAYAFARRLDEAVAHYRLTLEMEPGFLPAQFELARVLALQGEFEEARAVCRAARAGAPDNVRPVVAAAWVEARAGAAGAARAILAELEERATREYVPHFYVAGAYTALGDRERAIQHLVRACDERSGYAVFIRVEMFHDLQDDPRFAELLKRIGLV